MAKKGKMQVRNWSQAKGKLQTFGRINAWAFRERLGLPKRYQTEGQQVVYALMCGLPWEDWYPWDDSTYGCTRCDEEFENPYRYSIHPCAMRSAGVGSPSAVEENRDAA